MKHGYLGVAQMRFAEILWREAPLGSGELVKICEKELNWKKSTTYTVLRKLCEQGIFQNKDGVITVLITKENFIANPDVSALFVIKTKLVYFFAASDHIKRTVVQIHFVCHIALLRKIHLIIQRSYSFFNRFH